MVGIGFFAPLPLALMMPFMAGQSMLMGDAFGKAYQYGKRKISAMSNEEFNKLTPEQLGKEIVSDYSAMIPSLSIAIKQSSAFQSLIIQELATIIRSIPKDVISGFTQGTTGESNPVQTIVQQASQPEANIDYGKIALATLKIMLGPIAGSFNLPTLEEVEARRGSTTEEEIPKTDADAYAHTIGTHAGHTVGNIIVTQGPTEGPPEKPDYTPPPPTPPPKQEAPNKISIRTTSMYTTKIGQPTTGQVRKYLTTLMKKNSPAFRILSLSVHGRGPNHITHDWKVQNAKLVKQFAQFVFVIPIGY